MVIRCGIGEVGKLTMKVQIGPVAKGYKCRILQTKVDCIAMRSSVGCYQIIIFWQD